MKSNFKFCYGPSPYHPTLVPLCMSCHFLKKQAQKGFWPPSAMKGIGYFQILRNFLRFFLEIFWMVLGIFWEDFFGGIYFAEFFGRNFLGGFFWENFWEDLFWEEFFVYIGIDLFVKILVFVKILSQWRRKEGKNFRSLEVRLQVHRT